jgi:hypothetical protein
MSLVLTRFQNLRAADPSFDKNEYRFSRYGAHSLFQDQTGRPGSVVSQDLVDKALRANGVTLERAVIDYDGGISLGSTRTVTIADAENTSRMVSVTFTTISWGFTQVPAMFSNNEIAIQEDWNTKFKKYHLLALNAMDSAAIAALEAAKTQVLSDTLGGQYSLTSDSLVVPLDSQDQVLGDINPLMHGNDFYDDITIVTGPSGDSLIRNRLQEQGMGNTRDKRYQYIDKEFRFTNRISNGSGIKATMYAVAGGQTGVVNRVEREAIRQARSRTGHEWGIINLPIADVPCGTYYYESVGDYNAIGGASTADITRGVKEHYGFALDYAYITAYNSDPENIPSGILKVEVQSTNP